MELLSGDTFSLVTAVLDVMATLFVVVIGLVVPGIVITFMYDIAQTKSAIRRNYPVVGHFRYLFEHLGGFFRQYFFAMDREEMPFNRTQRSWVYRAAKNLDNTVGFGSTRDLRPFGTVLFVNCPFPTLGEDAVPPRAVTIGPGCDLPYTTSSLFNISGMSYGAISKLAVLALSRGAQLAGCWLNTGEGGLSPYHLEGGCDLVFQIGTAKNGVSDLQGKLNDDRLRAVTGKPTGIKVVLGGIGWLDTLLAKINERGMDSAPDFITVDDAEGGTGAASMPLIDAVGLPLRESLPQLVYKLNQFGLRNRVKVIASGKLVTPTDVAWALCMGADFVVSARGFMFAQGCIQALQCNRNTCPTGITTHNKRLQKGLDPQDKAVRVASYVRNMVYEIGTIAHSCGVREPRELCRAHTRVVGGNGLSVPLDELHPDVHPPTT